MKMGVDMLRGLRYKLSMMGVAIDSTTHVYGDNMSVIKNISKPDSTSNKKSNTVCYHAVRESVAMAENSLRRTYQEQKTLQTLWQKYCQEVNINI